ncbi:MAG: N-acyl-D-amino-acid deacylase family protein [Steroidobacteraceae bacterium]
MSFAKRFRCLTSIAVFIAVCASALAADANYADVIIHGGTIYDGSGKPGRVADIAIRGDRIVAIGNLRGRRAATSIDATGLAVSPGFINMLSWATQSLIMDPKSQSDIRQGVTLEVMGEGDSMGPLTAGMKDEILKHQSDYKYSIEWTTLGEYLDYLEKRKVAPNVASFIGATTVRVHEIGYENRPPTPAELGRMEDLVRQSMREGALGVGSSLIYSPASYSTPAEIKALALAAGESGGGYISHMRSEGNRLLEGIDEVLDIARATRQHAEIYHFKAAGESNWPKINDAIAKVEAARAAGLDVSADMYTYTAGATGLDAANPPWVQEGGLDAWVARLKDPTIRKRVLADMRNPEPDWENLLLAAGSPDRVLLIGFKTEKLKPLTGKTLAEVARMRGTSPEETVLDLVAEDGYRVDTAYFLMSEENVTRQLQLPWVALGSDEESLAPEGVFLEHNPHPRAYGNFARFLGHYVREEKVATLPDAIRRLTSLPAKNLRLRDRGSLAVGYYADVVVFDPDKIIDHATFDQPHQYSTGVVHVFVNGQQVLKDGEHTGALPGRFVHGPGWTGWPK